MQSESFGIFGDDWKKGVFPATCLRKAEKILFAPHSAQEAKGVGYATKGCIGVCLG